MNHAHDHHDHDNGRPVHPSQRPAEPEHPMSLEGGVVHGDTGLMLRCLIEELLMAGFTPDDLRRMARLAEYQALHAALCTLGEDRTDEIIAEAAGRVGTLAPTVVERADRTSPATLTIGATTGNADQSRTRQGA